MVPIVLKQSWGQHKVRHHSYLWIDGIKIYPLVGVTHHDYHYQTNKRHFKRTLDQTTLSNMNNGIK